MTVRIEKDVNGKDVIWSEVGGKAALLAAENIYIRAGDGHCFVIFPSTRGVERLRPHEVAMVEFWLRERAPEIVTKVFAGETPPATPEAEEATEPELEPVG